MNIVWRHGYHCEEHIVKTSDGWNLKLFRIPAANNSLTTPIESKKPILLQHGLLADASTWVICDNDSIGMKNSPRFATLSKFHIYFSLRISGSRI